MHEVRMKVRRWTDKELAYLYAHRKDPYVEIAKVLGRSVAAVNGKYCMLGMDKVKVPHWTEKAVADLKASVARGESDAKIAKRQKRTTNAVRQKRILLDLKKR